MNMIRKLVCAIRRPKTAAFFLINKFYSTFRKYLSPYLKELFAIKKRSLIRSDISDHLLTSFTESLFIKPKLIVELGVKDGESTFVLERVARLCGSKLVSVDIEDYSHVSSWKEWIFIHSDDIEFAQKFESKCKEHDIQPKIDVLFIDTNHIFEHTIQEIEAWFPFMSNKSKVFFHDTNLKEVYFRKDGSMDFACNNERGVIRALEKYFNKSFNEEKDFVDLRNGWLIKHYSHCCGFTVLEKLSPEVSDSI